MIEWTGKSMRNAGLLYLSYQNHAVVRLEGEQIGEVFHLMDGRYEGRVPGLRHDPRATAAEAADDVVEMHRKYRS